MPAWGNDDVNDWDKVGMRFTLLFRKISVRCLAPWSPMWFLERLSNVSIYVRKIECTWGRQSENVIYRIFSHCTVKLLNFPISDLIVDKFEFFFCLYEKAKYCMLYYIDRENDMYYTMGRQEESHHYPLQNSCCPFKKTGKWLFSR